MSNTQQAPKIKLLAEQEIRDSMADLKFYETLPEFLPIRAKMKTMHDDIVKPKGCTTCAKNRAYRSYAGDYLRIVQNLSEDGKARLRTYFGADALQATVLDPATQKPKTVRI